MRTDIVIPSVGEAVTTVVVAKIIKASGAQAAKDDVVAELETDKVNVELRAPDSGVLTWNCKEGDTLDVGAVAGSIEVGATAAAGAAAPAAPAPASNGAASKPEPVAAAAPAASAATPAHAGADADHRATPLARKLAAELNVDIAQVHGTGASGKVREEDVRAFVDNRKGGVTTAPAPAAGPKPAAAPKPAAPAGPAPAGATRERMSPLRQRIASRLVEAQHTAAMLTTFNEADMGAVMDLRKQYKEEFEKKHAIGLGFMGFFVKAACAALKAFPLVNAYIVEGDDGHPAIEKHGSCDVAVAVSTPKGLVVPVLRGAQRMSLADIEKGIKDLAGRARDGKLTLEDMQGGTFTITNGGVFGSLMSTPILNPPQSAILGMHSIKNRPVEYPVGSGQIALRPMMYLALSYDHRIVDGAEAVQFLVKIKQAIEDPHRLLLEM